MYCNVGNGIIPALTEKDYQLMQLDKDFQVALINMRNSFMGKMSINNYSIRNESAFYNSYEYKELKKQYDLKKSYIESYYKATSRYGRSNFYNY